MHCLKKAHVTAETKAMLANPCPKATMAYSFYKCHVMAHVSKSQFGQSTSKCHYGRYVLQKPLWHDMLPKAKLANLFPNANIWHIHITKAILWPIVQKAILANYVFV